MIITNILLGSVANSFVVDAKVVGWMAWPVLGRCCCPTVDTFFTVLLFGLGGTLLTVLWTFEPRTEDQHVAEDELRRQIVEEFLHGKDQIGKELDRLYSASNDDHHIRDGPLNDGHSSNRRGTESPKRRTHFSVVHDAGNDDQPPKMVLRNPGRTGVPQRAQLTSQWTARAGLDHNRTLSVNPSDHRFLQKVRRKLFSDVIPKPEVARRTRRSNKTQLVYRDGSDNSRRCSVYNTTPEVDELFDCIRLLIKPPTTVCLYPEPEDVYVTRYVRQDGLWEPHIVRLFQNLLSQHPELGVIDIGSHVGQYALLAASMGRRVVAVEPHQPSLRRLHKAVKINNVEEQVKLKTRL